MDPKLTEQLERFEEALRAVEDADALYDLQVRFIGKKGAITALKKQMGKLSPDERKAFGMAFNQVKQSVEDGLARRREELEAAARERELSRFEDLTALTDRARVGTAHPITQTRRELESIFRRLGFDVLEGPHIESELYNFDKLNFVPGHPARDMQDPFFVRGLEGEDGLLLRTHTSPVQVRAMLTHRPPIRVVAPGTVFRRDDDATHSPMFNQIEGLRIDRGVTMADLKATLERFISALFGAGLRTRFRPSFFPFVEPGAEFDMQCPFCRRDDGESVGCGTCKGSGWIELGGSGMVHPNVLRAVDYDPEEFSGWAFGFGIDRMAMLLHGVRDLRLFFEGDVRFLEQFPC